MTTSDADAHFNEWMRSNLLIAARHFGLRTSGEPVFGWRLRSIGSATHNDHGSCWLRVVSQEREWASGDPWTGTVQANAITGIPKPRLLDVFEWDDGRRQRAELTTLMPGKPCATSDVLRSQPELSSVWWTELGRTLDVLARVDTDRVHCDQQQVTSRIQNRFGSSINTNVGHWETVHGDLHWSNLMNPFAVLDWELWGRGPAGTDAATLLCYSLLVPETVAAIREHFGDTLDTPTGRVAQLNVAARLLRRADDGDFPDLAVPLTDHTNQLLRSP